MADETSLTPYEAGLAANNVYYTLGGWSAFQQAKAEGKEGDKPGGEEDIDIVEMEVIGGGKHSLGKGDLKSTFTATTGVNTSTGFGYILEFDKNGQKHVIVATRGTRPEIGAADLLTDLYFTPSATFMGSLVHRGFALTFDSLKSSIENRDEFASADYIHCVGHSLGGAIANLVSMYLKSKHANKNVKLYTFGAPRVGTYMGFPGALEKALGNENIYRISHTLDPITMIPTFPFLHVLGDDSDNNNITLKSPSSGPTMANHSMETYAKEMMDHTWSSLRGLKYLPSFEDRMMVNIWNGPDGPLKKSMKLTGGALVWVLMKILKGIAKLFAGAVITLVATPLDLICRLLYWGAQQIGKLGKMVWSWIVAAAEWAGAKVKDAADVTTAVLRWILEKLWAGIKIAAQVAIDGLILMGQAYSPMFVGPMAYGTMSMF